MLVLIHGRDRTCEVGGCNGPAEFMDKEPTNFGSSWTDFCGVCARITFGAEALMEAQEALSMTSPSDNRASRCTNAPRPRVHSGIADIA